MRVYLAAPYVMRSTLRSYVERLQALDVVCTSSWLDESHEISEGTVGAAVDLDDAEASAHALTDLEDIDDCDVFILFTQAWVNLPTDQLVSGGRHVETGYALARGKYVIVIGDAENIFHRITAGAVEVVASWHEAEIALQRWQIRQLRDQLREVSA